MLKRRKGPKLVRRQTPVYKEFPRGGQVGNPPEGCPYKRKFEAEGGYWVDSALCGFYCQDYLVCKAFKDYLFETRQARLEGKKDSED